MSAYDNRPALTHTLEDFISEGQSDEMVYKNFNIQRQSPLNYTKDSLDGAPTDKNIIDFCTTNVLDFYMDELKTIYDPDSYEGTCVKVTEFSEDEIARFKYHPDLLSYYIYGTTQLDWVIMLCNGIIDPKEFDFKRGYLLLPRKGELSDFLSSVYNAESRWLATSDNYKNH